MSPAATARVPSRLAERVEALGFALLHITPDGEARAAGPCSWFERTLIGSATFARAAKAALEDIDEQPTGIVKVFPGLHLVPTGPAPAADVTGRGTRTAALILGPEILKSEPLRRICDHAQLDWQATKNRVDTERLVSEGEAQRLGQVLGWIAADAVGLQTHRHELRGLSEELSNNYEELSLLYKLSCSMGLDQAPDDFFNTACEELQQVSGLGWIGLQIQPNELRLQSLRGRTYCAGKPLPTAAVERLGLELLQRYPQQSDPVILDDAAPLGDAATELSRGLLIVPLRREDQTLGILFGGDRLDGEYISSIDAKLCASLSNSLAIFLENHMLFEDAQTLFLGTLKALTAAIDAKDSYTFGHSERVALMSRTLADAAGLDPFLVERVHLSGLVHDVGKIGVPESTLCKPGRLTDEEFGHIKEHPTIGGRILGGIRQMDDLIPGVLFHHERWDGRGYPDGLAGLDIPLFGRLIGLADAFDAMSSNRTYRAALHHEKVLEEIRDNAGSQFDPELAEVFLGLDFGPYFEMIQRHREEKGRGPA